MYIIYFYNSEYLLRRYSVCAPFRQRIQSGIYSMFKYHNGYHFFFILLCYQSPIWCHFCVFPLCLTLHVLWTMVWNLNTYFIYFSLVDIKWTKYWDWFFLKTTYIFLCIVNPIITSKAITITKAREISTTFDGSLHIEVESK